MPDWFVSRRKLLATIGGTGTIAGCAGRSDGDSSSSAPDDSTNESSQETTPEQTPKTIHVSKDGAEDNSGAKDAPLASIRTAVERAQPGQTIKVQPGEYREFIEFRTDGTPDNPITLTGPPEAVLKPPKDVDYGTIGVGASHIHITGLTISGLYNPAEPERTESYTAGHLVTLNTWAEDGDDYLEGLVVSPHRIGNAGGALINSVMIKDCDIGGFEVIGPAGTEWLFDDENKGHYGEIVYLGTAQDNRAERGYDEHDRTRNIRVHHIDNSAGHPHSELVDIKEGCGNITVEYCTDSGGVQSEDSTYSQAIQLGGHNCTIRWNIIQNAQGSGIEIGPWGFVSSPGEFLAKPQTEFERQLGKDNAIYGNVFTGNAMDAIDFLRESKVPGRETNPGPEDQRLMCDNFVDAYSDGNPEQECDSDHPSTDGVGHLGGESPWERTAPTAADILARDAQDSHLDVAVETTTATVNETMEIPVSVTNNGTDTAEVELEFRLPSYVFETRQLAVPSNETVETIFSAGATSEPKELSLLRNGQKVAAIEVEES